MNKGLLQHMGRSLCNKLQGSRIADRGSGPRISGLCRFWGTKLLVTYTAQKMKKYFLQKIAVTGVTV